MSQSTKDSDVKGAFPFKIVSHSGPGTASPRAGGPEVGATSGEPVSVAPGANLVAKLISIAENSDLCVELQPGVNKVGRQRDGNHIVLVSGEISRFHAEITVAEQKITIRDLGSSNGTLINDERITQRELKSGDRITFSTQFNFSLQVESSPQIETSPLPQVASPPEAPQVAATGDPVEEEPQRVTEEGIGSGRLLPRASRPSVSSSVKPQQKLVSIDSELNATAPEKTSDSPEMAALERERRQLSVLYQVSKRCLSAESLVDLDRLLVDVLERIVSFDKGFITYQLPSGDWKLVMSPKGEKWDRTIVRTLLMKALKLKSPKAVNNSQANDELGTPGPGRADARLLLPLRSRTNAIGAIFLKSGREGVFDEQTVDFLSLFADIAALAIVSCSRFENTL